MEICLFCFVITFKIVCATYNASSHNDFQMTITPKHSVNVTEGQHLQVTCSINYPVGKGAALYWKAHGKDDSSLIKQHRVNDSTVMLIVRYALRSDAGFYKCFYNNSTHSRWEGVFISVISKSKGGAKCSHTQFLCETDKHCIFLRYRCNGEPDCKDGSDEKNCDECEGKFPCQSGKCIPRSLVCDDNHNNDCGDWSDEYCLMADKYQTEKTTTFNITAKERDKDHMTWLKTTVYVVIGCTVSAVLFISVIVIAVFRIRMKRDSFRHADRAVDRRGNRPSSGTPQVDGNIGRSLEHDPFISSYGNIIVNVNNGVQYVPGVDFTPITSPPSYSDVERETHARRHSPPPEYSTVDRNPQRPSILPVACLNNNNNNSYHGNRNNTDQSHALYAISNSNQNENNNESFSDLELNPAVSSVGTQTPPAAPQVNASNSETVMLPNTNLIIAQGTCNTTQTRQPNLNIQGGEILISGENVISNSSILSGCEDSSNTGRRSRLLQVQDGNLFLTNEHHENMPRNSVELGSTAAAPSENVSCSERTCLLAENSSVQNAEHPAHLEVHDGEIILTNQASAYSRVLPVLQDHSTDTVRRELDVQGGQIIFK